jgi:hypothetical protein
MAEGLGKRQIASMLNWVFGKTPTNTPSGIVWVALFVGDPGADGQSGAEGSGTGYARVATVATDWNAATDATPSVVDNANPITFPAAGGDWNAAANFTHFALFDHVTNTVEANYIGRGALTTAQPVLSGQTATFPAAALTMSGTETA